MSTGNFLELAQIQNGISVGFGKMILIYSTKKDVAISALTATAINDEIAAGTIVGVIKDWNMVAGASVAEKNKENLDSTISLVKGEILADNLTFDRNTVNMDVLERLVSFDSCNCILLDDMGYAFGERSLVPESIGTMLINFSNKTTNGLQNDLTNEGAITVTARYLLKKIGYVNAGTEVEEITPKIPLTAKVSSITTHTSTSIVFVMDMYNDVTGALLTTFDVDPVDIGASVNGITVTPSATFGTNQLTVTLAKTVANFNTTTDKIKLRLSTAEYYLTEISFNIADFLA